MLARRNLRSPVRGKIGNNGRLPARGQERPHQQGSDEGPAEIREEMRPKKTILCVDDNEQVLSVRKFLLETRGYRVLIASGAQEAMEIAERALPGAIDLLLCDLVMPQMDGNELIRRIKQIHPSLPSLLISGTVSSFERAAAADVFLPKGASSPSELLERIRVLCARKRGPKRAVPPPVAEAVAS